MGYFFRDKTKQRYGQTYTETVPTIHGVITACALVIGFFILLLGIFSGLARCGPGEACVVRNGGWFDDKHIRKTMQPGTGIQAVGFFSEIRHYRSSDNQSQYRITDNPDESDTGGVDFVEVPTKDGVLVRLKATTFFTTAFTGSSNDLLLREFDQRFGNRTFKGQHVWDGTEGYRAWQDEVFRPLLNNAIRKTVLTFDCEDLISSCALVRAGTTGGDITKLTQNRDNSQNFDKVGQAIADKLRENIQGALRSGKTGDTFLTNISFKLEDVTLPDSIQGRVNAAQGANVQIAEKSAKAKADAQEAKGNRILAASLKKSPELKQVKIAEIYAASSNPHLVIVQGGGTPFVNTP